MGEGCVGVGSPGVSDIEGAGGTTGGGIGVGGGAGVGATTGEAQGAVGLDVGGAGGAGVGIRNGGVSLGAGFGGGVGIGVEGRAAAGCVSGVGVTRAFDGSTSFGLVVANVIGEVVWAVGGGAAVEIDTMRAVPLGIASGDGSGWGDGFTPWISSFRSSRVWIRPLMTVRHRVTSALSAVRILKFRYVWNS